LPEALTRGHEILCHEILKDYYAITCCGCQLGSTSSIRDSSLTHQPSISADGNFVVYASDRATGKDLDIWIQHVSGGQPVRLTSTAADESYPSISADGRTVAFQVN